MVTAVNSGLPVTKPPTPGISGYRPIAANTYQEESEPASSLPGSPPGVFVKSCVSMRRTTSWVCDGAPAKSYSQGISSLGSLPMKAYWLVEPSLSLVKKVSRRPTTTELPPSASKSPRRLKDSIQVDCAESVSWKPCSLVELKFAAQLPSLLRGCT